VTVRENRHVPSKPSSSLEISVDAASGLIAWWGGDSVVNPELLVRLEPTTSVFFHDCTFLEQPGLVHGVFSELKQLPARVREKIVLMHHDDSLPEHEAQAAEFGFRLLMPGKVIDMQSGQEVGETRPS
jgi:hypothetical protein